MPKLSMDHLKAAPEPDIAELKKGLATPDPREAAETAAPAPEALPDPRDAEEWTFALNYVDRRGRAWTGTFTNKILSMGNQLQVAVIRARLLQNTALAQLDDSSANLAHMIAHLTLSLTQAPKWAADLRELRDVKVLYAIYEQVSEHERIFFRHPADPGQGPLAS